MTIAALLRLLTIVAFSNHGSTMCWPLSSRYFYASNFDSPFDTPWLLWDNGRAVAVHVPVTSPPCADTTAADVGIAAILKMMPL
jgi:hypothetical protein